MRLNCFIFFGVLFFVQSLESFASGAGDPGKCPEHARPFRWEQDYTQASRVVRPVDWDRVNALGESIRNPHSGRAAEAVGDLLLMGREAVNRWVPQILAILRGPDVDGRYNAVLALKLVAGTSAPARYGLYELLGETTGDRMLMDEAAEAYLRGSWNWTLFENESKRRPTLFALLKSAHPDVNTSLRLSAEGTAAIRKAWDGLFKELKESGRLQAFASEVAAGPQAEVIAELSRIAETGGGGELQLALAARVRGLSP